MNITATKTACETATSSSVHGSRLAAWRPSAATVVILIASTLACAWLVFASARIELTFLDNYGYFYDPASYYVMNVNLYRDYQELGLWKALGDEITSNYRCPGRTVPYLLFAPNLLTSPMGHVWSEAPLLWVFLLLLCSTIHDRTKSLFFALSAASVFVGLPFLYDPKLGVSAFWLDFTAGCALGGAALCLLRFSQTRHNGWMFGLGALASATALCRWTAAFYLLTFLALAVPLTVLVSPLKTQLKSIGKSLACALTTALPGLVFTVYFFERNSDLYTRQGYALGAPIAQSVIWTASALQSMCSTPVILLLLGFGLANLFFLMRNPSRNWRFTLTCIWLPVSLFLFICVVVKAVDGYHPLVYFAPALFVAAFCPLTEFRTHRKWWHTASVALCIVAVATTVHSYDTYRRLAKNAPPAVALQKQCDVALSKLIVQTRSSSFVQFDHESLMPQLEAFFSCGLTCDFPQLFSVHQHYMRSMFRDQSPQMVAQTVYRRLQQEVPLVAVFSNPDQALQPGIFNNVYSSTVSRHVSQKVAADPNWKLVGHVEGPQGKLSIFQNRLPTHFDRKAH